MSQGQSQPSEKMSTPQTQNSLNGENNRSMVVRVKGIDGIYRTERLCDVLTRLAKKRAVNDGQADEETGNLTAGMEATGVGHQDNSKPTPSRGGDEDVDMKG